MGYSHVWWCQQRLKSLDYIFYCYLIKEIVVYEILKIRCDFFMVFPIKKENVFPSIKLSFSFLFYLLIL